MDPNVYMPLTAAATFCALLALGFGMKRGRGQRTAAHGGEPVLGGATDDDGEPPGGPPPAPSPLMLTYAFVVSLIVIIPSVYVIFFNGPVEG